MANDFKDKPFIKAAIKGAIKKNATRIETKSVDEIVFGGYTSQIFEALRSMQPLMEKMGIHKEIPEKMAILWSVSILTKLRLAVSTMFPYRKT